MAVRATNLPDGSTEAEVRELFKQYGQIADVYVSDDTKTCHVHYYEKESSSKAVADLQKTVFYNESEEVHWNLECIQHEVPCKVYEYQRQIPGVEDPPLNGNDSGKSMYLPSIYGAVPCIEIRRFGNLPYKPGIYN